MNTPTFKFTSHAAGGDQFTVVSYTATEGLSRLYRYDITLKAPISAAIDLDDMLDNPARFIIESAEDEFPLHGVLSTFDEVRMSGEYIFYQAILVPRLWKLSTYKTNEIYTTETTVDNIIRTVLDNADLKENVDFDISGVKNTLLQRDYVCQFRESDFAFISRLMENEGIYFFFEQGADAEMLVIADDGKYDPITAPTATFDTAPQSHRVGETIQSWLCRKQQLPENVTVRDYNPEQPSLDVYDTHTVDAAGQGTEYLYGENFLTESEAEHLSQVRAEAFICRKTRYYGESGICGFSAGYTFDLNGHPNDKYNDTCYLIIDVTHEGQFLDQNASDNADTKPIYNNTFVATEVSIPYRPPMITPKPRFFGTMTAFVYAEATSEMAEINGDGYYRVHLPFDKADGSKDSTDPDRKASCWIRMAQPYVGEGEGMYFPLRGGTEVLLTFINGDPDRPIISGALPNASTPSLLTSDKPTESVIRTKGNNKIRMEDEPGSERLMLESPMANSWVRVGAPNDPVTLNGSATVHVPLGTSYTEEGAFSTNDAVDTQIAAPTTIRRADGTVVATVDANSEGVYYLEYVDGDHTALRVVTVGDLVADTLPGMGIRIQTSGNFFLEAQSQHAEYTKGTPSSASLPRKPTGPGGANQIGDLYDKFAGTGDDKIYTPSGMINYLETKTPPATPNTDFVTSVFNSAHVQLSSLDTVNTQEGNVYDFGGYWSYNLGNGYTEEWVHQSALLNAQNSLEWPADGSGASLSTVNSQRIQMGISLLNTFTTVALVTPLVSVSAPHIGSLVGGIVGGAVGGLVSGVIIGAINVSGAETIQVNIGDVIAGPNSGKIESWKGIVGSSFTNVDASTGAPTDEFNYTQNFGENADCKAGPMHTDTTWVEKTFGDHYDFNKGNSIDINIGHKEEHQRGDSYEFRYGGKHEEYKFDGDGKKCVWERYEKNTKTELHWDQVSGELISAEYVNHGHFFANLTLPSLPKLHLDLSLNSMDISLSASVGMKIDISASAGVEFEVKAAAGLYMSFERKIGGEIKLNEITGKFEFKTIGFKAAKEEAIEAKSRNLVLEQMLTKMKKDGLVLEDESLGVKSGGLTLDTVGFKFT